MIEKLKFKFGASAGKNALEIHPTTITVFVGPNNSGKSKAISEIYEKCAVPKKNLVL